MKILPPKPEPPVKPTGPVSETELKDYLTADAQYKHDVREWRWSRESRLEAIIGLVALVAIIIVIAVYALH